MKVSDEELVIVINVFVLPHRCSNRHRAQRKFSLMGKKIPEQPEKENHCSP